MSDKPPLQLARDAYLSLVRAHDRLSNDFTALFRSHELTQAQYNVLRILRGARGEKASCQTISEQLVTRVPDVTRLVDRMASSGLVVRRRGEDDRRVVWVHLTEEGRQRCATLDGPVDALHLQHARNLDHEELAAFCQSAQRLGPS